MITSDETIEVINARYNERTIIKLIKQFITEELHGRYAVSTLKTKKYVMYQFTSYLRKLIESTNECMDCFLFPCNKTKHSGKCPLRNPLEISIVKTKTFLRIKARLYPEMMLGKV